MIRNIAVLIIVAVMYGLHETILNFESKEQKDSFDMITISSNNRISDILKAMRFVKKYNGSVYDDLVETVDKIIYIYYRHIEGKPVVLDDIAFHKSNLGEIYEELSLNLPLKYHDRLKKHIVDLNKEISKKMKLIKVRSSKSPIKISLMSTK